MSCAKSTASYADQLAELGRASLVAVAVVGRDGDRVLLAGEDERWTVDPCWMQRRVEAFAAAGPEMP